MNDFPEMPARSISWRWEKGESKELARFADITYNRKIVGRMERDANWEVSGYISYTLPDGVQIEVRTLDCYEEFQGCGNQLYWKFKKACRRAGYNWPL